MGDRTGISWTDATWNPIRGCSRVSEGCRNCYAENVAARFSGPGQPYEGLAIYKDGDARWTGEVRFVEKHLEDPLRWRRPRRVFVNSMSDLFHENVKDEWICRIIAVMGSARRHSFQVLTKRRRMRDFLLRVKDWEGWMTLDGEPPRGYGGNAPVLGLSNNWPLPNVWFGVSVEDQTTADERVPILMETPNAVPWVSYEPALAPVSFWPWLSKDAERRLRWIVYGGESGTGFRPDDVAWARLVRDQCAASGTAFFYKQSSGPRPGMNPDALGEIFHEYPEASCQG